MNAVFMMFEQQMNHTQGVGQIKTTTQSNDRAFAAALSERAIIQGQTTEQSARIQTLLGKLSELLETDQSMMNIISLEKLALLLEELGFGPFDDELLAVMQQFLEANQATETLQQTVFAPPFYLNVTQTSTNEQQATLAQYTTMFHEARALLAQVAQGEDVQKVAPKLLELLESWTKLTKLDQQTLDQLQKVLNQHPREGQLWQELLTTFQKRHQLATNQQYQMNAGVTKQDIASWLTRALAADVNVEQTVVHTGHHLSSMPMSKVEQYVIHLQQGQVVQPVDKQMMDQLQNMIKSQRFISTQDGFKQLSIRLQPENLGNMVVRLTELHGEMTVKILVSSQATRQMLEANMHQLKNMFAPHQVVIEESNELNLQKLAEDQEQQDQPLDDQDSRDEQEQAKQQAKEDVNDSFHEVLMNLKV